MSAQRAGDLKFDPYNGWPWTSSVPIQAETYRTLYPKRVWWNNPWTGQSRDIGDVNDNPYMENVAAPREPVAVPLDECCAQEGADITLTASYRSALGAITVEKAKTEHDPVEHPTHYTSHPSGVECITITEHMGFNLGNALKYIWRADLKANAIEDLKKARWYLDRELEKRGAV